MRRTYLTTVAAIALLAGTGLASAQRMEGPAQKNDAPNLAPNTQQQAPAEKIAPKSAIAPDKGAQTKPAKPETTGQSQPQQPQAQPQTGQPRAGDDQPKGGQPKGAAQAPNAQPKSSDTAQQPKAQPAPTTGQATAPAGAAVTLNADQKTKIRSTVLTSNAPRATNVNFSIHVGTVVPRTVRLVAVPPPLIEIHPAWRGYLYFVVGDEIIIVEPRTLKIVAVLVV